MQRWNPEIEPSKREQAILKRLERTRKLFKFLRLHRHEIFDEAFQDELAAMYRQTGAGDSPVPPAMLCLVVLLQAYLRISDAEAVELSIMDARWSMVLGCLGSDDPPFSQGALQAFRNRLIAHDMDRRLLERTVEVARATEEFDWKKLPKELRLAIDSRPFEGAGRVEDVFNLLGHALRKLIDLSAQLLECPAADIYRETRIPNLLHISVKAVLDIDWSDPDQKAEGLAKLLTYVTRLQQWLERRALLEEEPLAPYLASLARVQEQNLEVDEDGRAKIRRGVAEERQVSIEDPEMRHGRKSSSKRFNGFKEHIATDLDSGLVMACAVTPANRPEEDATPALAEDLRRFDQPIGELSVDRAYVNSDLVRDVRASGGEVLAKPWRAANTNGDFLLKTDFKIDVKRGTITCLNGQVERFEPGTDSIVRFNAAVCNECVLRIGCTNSASGRSVSISKDEAAQQGYRKLQGTVAGRAQLRRRVPVEHRLAHIARKQGPRARYLGTRKNLFDLRRTAALINLEVIHARAAA